MIDGEETPTGEETPPEETPKKPDPTSLTKDEILGIVRATVGESVTASVRALMTERAPAPTDPPIDDVTDEEIEEAVSNGKGSAAYIRKAIKAGVERATREMKRETESLGADGGRAINRLALAQVAPTLDYYERFKKEIDSAMLNAPRERLGDPDFAREVHDFLVSKNLKAIMAEEREALLRERDQPKPTQAGVGRVGLRAVQGGKGGKGGQLRPEDVFAPDELDSLRDLGSNRKGGRPEGFSFDRFCRDVLHRDPQEYLRLELARREAERGTGTE